VTASRIPNVEGGIQPTIVTAKGDLIAAVANASPGRLGVGSDGQLLTADSTAATGLSYQNNFAAGKNKIINGDFGIWQRGTSAAIPANEFARLADRWYIFMNGTYSATQSQQTFTPGTAPVSGYEGQYFWRNTISSITGSLSLNRFGQKIEDARTLAGQTVTISFWAKAGANASWTPQLVQEFGSGGSGSVFISGAAVSVTTSWQRFTQTVSVPSVSGKTIGAGSSLTFIIDMPLSSAQTNDVWGVQVEAGSVATAFQTATGTIQGELAACQRYYQLSTGFALTKGSSSGGFSTNAYDSHFWVTEMRTTPTITFSAHDGTTGAVTLYVGGSALKSNSVASIVAYSWGFMGSYSATAWGSSADSGMLNYKYIASAEL
jgi:hypothetical protein